MVAGFGWECWGWRADDSMGSEAGVMREPSLVEPRHTLRFQSLRCAVERVGVAPRGALGLVVHPGAHLRGAACTRAHKESLSVWRWIVLFRDQGSILFEKIAAESRFLGRGV